MCGLPPPGLCKVPRGETKVQRGLSASRHLLTPTWTTTSPAETQPATESHHYAGDPTSFGDALCLHLRAWSSELPFG